MLYVSILCIFIIFLIFYRKNIKNETYINSSNKIILFTCTTFVTLPGKFNELRRALNTFLKYNTFSKIKTYIVINEYDPNSGIYISKLQKEFPSIIFWNKSIQNKGQAKSLNLIIDYLKQNKYKYWLHWEDSWYCNERFIDISYKIMENSNIDQLTFKYNHWEHINLDKRYTFLKYKDYNDHVEIIPRNKYLYKMMKNNNIHWQDNISNWPLFTLSPGIDRVSTILKCGYFETDYNKWPITFEYNFALIWIQKANKIANLKKKYIDRKKNHKSTYNLT